MPYNNISNVVKGYVVIGLIVVLILNENKIVIFRLKQMVAIKVNKHSEVISRFVCMMLPSIIVS